MNSFQARTSEGTSIKNIFMREVITRSIADDKPRRSNVTFEFNDGSCVRVWFEVIDLDGWEVTGALRVVENSLKSDVQGVSRDICPPSGMLVTAVSLLYADVEVDGAKYQVVNGLVLSGSKGESITIVSSPVPGAMDFGINVALEVLDTEYSVDNYQLFSLD